MKPSKHELGLRISASGIQIQWDSFNCRAHRYVMFE